MKSYTKALVLAASLIPLVAATTTTNSDESAKPLKSFFMAISMIGVSEIGDKTFLIAALMAMRHTRWVVFSSAAASLAIMTILSGVAGHAFVSFIPENYTHFLAGILFLVFGYKLTKEGLAMAVGTGVEEELAEVEEELAATDMNKKMDDIETARSPDSQNSHSLESSLDRTKNLASFIFSPVWVQIFIMIFLAEFGDRSQISIIAMASDANYWFTISGAVIGHLVCTGLAVIGGKMLATKISMRTVTLGGAFSFFVFGLFYIWDALYSQ